MWSNSGGGTEVELTVRGQLAYRPSTGKVPSRWLAEALDPSI